MDNENFNGMKYEKHFQLLQWSLKFEVTESLFQIS